MRTNTERIESYCHDGGGERMKRYAFVEAIMNIAACILVFWACGFLIRMAVSLVRQEWVEQVKVNLWLLIALQPFFLLVVLETKELLEVCRFMAILKRLIQAVITLFGVIILSGFCGTENLAESMSASYTIMATSVIWPTVYAILTW